MKKILLKLINYLERTPSHYARIDNIRNYSRDFIESFKGKTIDEFLEEMDNMDRCMQSVKNCVISNNGTQQVNDLSDYF